MQNIVFKISNYLSFEITLHLNELIWRKIRFENDLFDLNIKLNHLSGIAPKMKIK